MDPPKGGFNTPPKPVHEHDMACSHRIPINILAREVIADELCRIREGAITTDEERGYADRILTALAHAGLYVAVAGDEMP
jgi:hypothetical protein